MIYANSDRYNEKGEYIECDNSFIGFYSVPETTEENQDTFMQHFNAIAYTYGVDMQLVHHPEEIVYPSIVPIIVLEERSQYTTDYRDVIYPKKAVYVTGNSDYRRPGEFMDADYIIHIPVPNPDHPLYGSQALAIVFQHIHE